MKKFYNVIISVILAFVTMLACGCGCVRVSGNHAGYTHVNNLTIIGNKFSIDEEEFEIVNEQVNYNYKGENAPKVISGGTAPRYTMNDCSDYPVLQNRLMELHIAGNENSVILCKGYNYGDNLIYGICNVYNTTIGYLSGGGQYAEEEVNNGVFFKYDTVTEEFTIIKRVEYSLLVGWNVGLLA